MPPVRACARRSRDQEARQGLVVDLAHVAGWALLRLNAPSAAVARFESPFREGQAPIGPLEMIRDGSGVVYVGPGESGSPSQLWIRNWSDLEARDGVEQLKFYKTMLLHLGTEAKGLVQAIFADASTSLRQSGDRVTAAPR